MTYAITGQWGGGFQGDVRIQNTGSSAINGWSLVWSFANGQQVSQIWGATRTQSGATVTARNEAWNGGIAPNATASFGFIASWTGTNARPTAFTLNGSPCSVS